MKPLRLVAVLAAICLSALAACSKKDAGPTPAPSTYVLVHGAWQAPYAWQQVQQRLEQQGQRVLVVELPGHGTDNTAPATLTLTAYRDKVVAAILAQPDNVILVGHSLGGMVVTAVAEKIPARIRKLVYIGAFFAGRWAVAAGAGRHRQHLAAGPRARALGRPAHARYPA